MDSKKRYMGRLWTVLVMLAVMGVMLKIDPAGAGDPAAMQGGKTKTQWVTISEKHVGTMSVFVGERRFILFESTTILDPSGEKITLKDLPVPSEARITYQLFGDTRNPLILKIRLK